MPIQLLGRVLGTIRDMRVCLRYRRESMDDAEVHGFIAAYYAAYVPGNTDAILKYYAEPAMLVSENYAVAADTREALRELIDSGLSSLADIGFSHSRATHVGVHSLGPRLCRVAIRFERLHRDGTVMVTLGATYLLRFVDTRWEIVSVSVHSPDVDDLCHQA